MAQRISSEVLTDPAWQQYGMATRMIHARETAMLRRLGVYKPGSEHYPYPEPDTDETRLRVIAYFHAVTVRAHEHFCRSIGPRNRARIVDKQPVSCKRREVTT